MPTRTLAPTPTHQHCAHAHPHARARADASLQSISNRGFLVRAPCQRALALGARRGAAASTRT
eukprot:1685855-Pleurochrysis_carterae.AAC.1